MATANATTHEGLISRSAMATFGRVFAFALLIALAAQIRFYPPGSAVPVTLQSAAVLLCGYWLRPRLAVAAVGLYLAAGFALAFAAPGMSLFAAFALGKSVTLGYLCGFVIAAALISSLSGQFAKLTFGRALAVGMVGTAVILGCGVCWLAVLTGSMVTAIQQGLVPFAGWALVKTGLVAALASAVQLRK